MATTAGEFLGTGSPQPTTGKLTIGQWVDRWIYVIMAAWFIVTVLVGFVPDSIGKVMAVRQGFRPPFPAVLHVHAVLMGSWLLLLLAQTWLMATGRRGVHQQLGIAGAVLAPAMVLTGFFLVPAMFADAWAAFPLAPPEFLPGGSVESAHTFISSIVAFQIMSGVLFSLFVGWALLVRRTDAGTHKRLMILATSIPLPAAIDRIAWLPSTYPESAVSPVIYGFLWTLPMFLWDIYRQRRVHRAYVAFYPVYFAAAALVNVVWWTPGWVGLVQRAMGAG